jgi:peptidyl-dipeptidase Dcp
MSNPLLGAFTTPYQSTPFSKIAETDFLPALDAAIAKAKAEIDALIAQSAAPNFTNSIAALDFTGEEVGRTAEIFFNLNSAETNDNIQKLAREFSPKLTEYGNDILLNEALFARVRQVWDNRESEKLSSPSRKNIQELCAQWGQPQRSG